MRLAGLAALAGVDLEPHGLALALDAPVVGQLLDLIGDAGESEEFEGMPDLRLSDNTEVPEDPVLARLFPDAYREDQGASAEFRRYTEGGLREGSEDHRSDAALVEATSLVARFTEAEPSLLGASAHFLGVGRAG